MLYLKLTCQYHLEAYEALLSSRFLNRDTYGFNLTTYEHSQELLQRAIDLDPNFVEAWAGLASNLLRKYWFLGEDPKDLEEVKKLLNIASNLNPENEWVLNARGYYYYWGELDYDSAIKYFKQVAEIAPNQADLIDGLGYVYRRKGDFTEALNTFNHLIQIDPYNEYYVLDKAQLLALYQRKESALRIMEGATQKYVKNYDLDIVFAEIKDATLGGAKHRLEAMDQLLFDSVHEGELPFKGFAAYLHGIYGDTDKMRAMLRNWPSESISIQGWHSSVNGLRAIAEYVRNPNKIDTKALENELKYLDKQKQSNPNSATIEITTGYVHAILGNVDSAVKSAKRVRKIYPVSKDFMLGSDYFVRAIDILVMAGEFDQAFIWLDEYLALPTSNNLIEMKSNPLYANVIGDERFIALEKKYGLTHPDLSK